MEVEYYYVGYEDNGPSRPCGQSTSVCSKWRKLYIFTDYQKARNFIDSISNKQLKGRIRPRIIGFWSETKFQEEQVIRIN